MSILDTVTSLFDDKTSGSQSTRVDLRNMDELNQGEGAQAGIGRDIQMSQLDQLRQLLTRGGQGQIEGDIDAARSEQLNLAEMLRGALAGPSQADTTRAQAFARDIFAPQQEALSQQFQQAETDTSRLAARLGRQVDDPILRAKLAESQGRATAQLGAQQGAFAAQNAFGFQNQALQMQNQLAQVRGGLATQALQNRQALMGMGQSLLNQERNFRLQTAGQTTTSSQTKHGGIGDVIGAVGSIAGMAAGLPSFGGLSSMWSGGSHAAGTSMATNFANQSMNSLGGSQFGDYQQRQMMPGF